MTFDSAERANEAEEREDYSALQDADDESEMINNQAIEEYLSAAWEGNDDDWIICDWNRTNESMLKILAVVRDGGADPRIQVDAIRSIILAMQSEGALEYLRSMKSNGIL